jgi:3-methyladenine DNA glycosylase AlkD
VTDRPDRALVDAVRSALRAAADPAAAEPMRAYMKSSMPFLGVPMPARTAALRPVLAADPLADPAAWRGTVRTVFRDATYREERYAALAIARRYPRHLTAEPQPSLDLLDEIVVTGAWWDLVDEAAIRLLGPLLLRHPGTVRPAVRRWARDEDRWRRRAAVICQIGAKERTDTALLAEVIEANLADRDFFLRKGIGWALRQHARLDPDWVRTFAATHELSPLSRREALKHL